MTPERWQRVRELFEGALARPEAERAGWLDEACGNDGELRAEVERLLRADGEAGAFLGGDAVTAGEGAATGVPPAAAFGRYRVAERIGGGGFSEVFRGWDPVLRREVAIKTCRWASREVRERFAREAEIVARLDHPNVTTVYDFGIDGDTAFLVQELLGGEDLHRALEAGRPATLAARLDVLLQVARGLAYAHGRGVVHRDVKPSNLRLADDGRVKIMDFGIAALLGDAARLTQSGTVLGTVAYMAPEQLRGEPVDRRTDLYSFGAVAYELVAGRPPFRGGSLPGLLYQMVHEEPAPLGTAAPGCPPELAALVESCLERDPERRPSGFEHVIAGLEAVVAGEGTGATGHRAMDVSLGGRAAGFEEGVGGLRVGDRDRGSGAGSLGVGTAGSGSRRADSGGRTADGGAGATTEAPVRRLSSLRVTAAVAALAVGLGVVAAFVVARRSGESGEAEPSSSSVSALPAPSPPITTTPAGDVPLAAAPAAARSTPAGGAAGEQVGESPEAAPAAAAGSATAGGETVPVPTGLLAIDAAPWAEVVAIRDHRGAGAELPGEPYTPLAVALPPGVYTVTLRHPRWAASRDCTAKVAAGETAACRVEFARVAAADLVARLGAPGAPGAPP